jgi:Flp pilus assembly pilin Flp
MVYIASFMLSRVIVGVRGIAARYTGERGQDLIEYALLCGLVAAALIAAASLTGITDAIAKMATGIGNCIDFDDTSSCAPFG